jgi:hypothetical protein
MEEYYYVDVKYYLRDHVNVVLIKEDNGSFQTSNGNKTIYQVLPHEVIGLQKSLKIGDELFIVIIKVSDNRSRFQYDTYYQKNRFFNEESEFNVVPVAKAFVTETDARNFINQYLPNKDIKMDRKTKIISGDNIYSIILTKYIFRNTDSIYPSLETRYPNYSIYPSLETRYSNYSNYSSVPSYSLATNYTGKPFNRNYSGRSVNRNYEDDVCSFLAEEL